MAVEIQRQRHRVAQGYGLVAGEQDRATTARLLRQQFAQRLHTLVVQGIEGLIQKPDRSRMRQRQARQSRAPALALAQGAYRGLAQAGDTPAGERAIPQRASAVWISSGL